MSSAITSNGVLIILNIIETLNPLTYVTVSTG